MQTCIWPSWCHCLSLISCFSKIQIGFAFLVQAYLSSRGHTAVKRVCVCVCVWMAVVSLRVVYVCVGVVKARRRQQMRFWAHAGAVCWFITRTCRRRLRPRKPSTSRSTCDTFCLCLPLSCDFFLAFILRYAPTPTVARPHRYALHNIRYDTRCYFNMRSNADISHLNLLHWTKDKKVEN